MIQFGPYFQALVGDKRKPKYSKTSVTKRHLGISWLQPSSLSSPSKCISGPSITQMCSPPRFVLASALSTLSRQLKTHTRKGLAFFWRLYQGQGGKYMIVKWWKSSATWPSLMMDGLFVEIISWKPSLWCITCSCNELRGKPEVLPHISQACAIHVGIVQLLVTKMLKFTCMKWIQHSFGIWTVQESNAGASLWLSFPCPRVPAQSPCVSLGQTSKQTLPESWAKLQII